MEAADLAPALAETDAAVQNELQALEETGADEAVVGWKRIFEMVQ